MSRAARLLVALGALVVVVAWYLLVWSPRVESLEAVEADIDATLAQQSQTQVRIGELQLTREQAPDLQAELAAAAAVIPDETALPGALRQLQQAADDSGVRLVSVTPGRPTEEASAVPGLYAMTLSLQLEGGYFQIVDTLRRLEDPTISPRGMVWDNLSLSVTEHPMLTVTASGRMFATLAAPPTAPVEGEAAPAPDATDAAPDGADAPASDDTVEQPSVADGGEQ